MSRAPDPLLNAWLGGRSGGRALDLGTGSGATARWLARRGFRVEAVDRNPQCLRRLQRVRGVTPLRADLRDLHPETGAYTAITALAVLHFLEPAALAPLALRLQQSLRPGGLLLASVFSTDDPACPSLPRARATQSVPSTCACTSSGQVLHFFAQGELPALFAGLHVEMEEASRWIDARAEGGFHAGLAYVGRRPAQAGGV